MPKILENEYSPEMGRKKTRGSDQFGHTKETLVRSMKTMVGDAEFYRIASEIKTINDEHKFPSERFAKVVRARHKGFEKQWEAVPRIKELGLKGKRDGIMTKNIIFEDLKKFN
jgi:hypothetical protein